MHILGIGTNVVECVRIGRLIAEHGEYFLERVFTPRELRQCRAGDDPTERFAGQWAAKEAVLRSLGFRPGRTFSWTDIEVRSDTAAGLSVHVGGMAKDRAERLRVADIRVTIARCRTYATAYAIAVGKASPPTG